jgi:4-hydroxy-tetrahydrodipicolinate reductase
VKHRVIVWGTGFVGKMVLRELLDHPDFELAGLIVNTKEKVGKDAGEIAGSSRRTGVLATDDVDAALAAGADAVAYFANADIRQMEAIKDMVRPLARGIDVVNTSVFPLIHPKSAPSSFVAPIERACREGGSSFFTTGIDPGFCQDLIPMTLMGLTGRVDRVRIQEILDYSTYPNPRTLFDIMGFGRPVDDPKVLQLQPGALRFAWGCAVHMLADGLGVTLDEIRELHQRREASRTLDLPVGTVKQGTTAGLRFELQGIVGGEPRIVVEHVTRLAPDVAPDWPGSEKGDVYRILIDGSPSIRAEIAFRGAGDDANAGGCLSTGMRAINAIPAVKAAPPGLLTPFDLPLIPGRHNMR